MHRNFARPPNSPVTLPPTLLQFVLLSMLLHVLLVLLFGTTTSSGTRRGESLLGSLDVTLRQLAAEQGAGFTIAPGAETDRPGAALLRRLEGAARAPVAPAPRESAPVASPKNAIAAPASTGPVEAAPVEAAPAATRESVPDVSLPPPPQPVEALPKLDLRAPVEVDKPIVAPTVPPPQPEREILLPPVSPPVTPRREVMMPPITPLERIEPAKIDRQLAPPVDLRPRETPIAPRAPAIEPQPREEAQPAAVPAPQPIPPAKVERDATPPTEVRPRELPTPPADVRPRELPTPQKAAAEPAPPSRIAPTTEREAAPTPPLSARESTAPATIAPGKSPARSAASPAGGELPRLRLGTPDVDDEVFRSRRDPPAAEAGGKGPVTVESMRKRAREIASESGGSRGVLNLIPPPPAPERKDSLAEGIAKAAKPDCRTAYAGMGLLAVVPLVASSVGNGGCNW